MSESTDVSLPGPLACAVTQLRDWMLSELRADELRTTPREPLYHYTVEAALRGIIEKQQLWCFIHNCQKDREEVKYSLNIARQAIDEEARSGGPYARSLLCGLNGMLDTVFDDQRFDFYFFSLSAHRDDAGQWANYGDKGKGFAIGFSPALFQPNQKTPLPCPTENAFVGQVIYGREATFARHRKGVRKLAKLAEGAANANPWLAPQWQQAWFDSLNHEFIATLLIWNCLTAKRESFHCERETRFIILWERETFDPARRRHNNRDYIETPLPLSTPENIVEILVGRDAPGDAEAMVTELLTSNGYPGSIPVRRSAAGP